jgi:hypothetical protein
MFFFIYKLLYFFNEKNLFFFKQKLINFVKYHINYNKKLINTNIF